MRPLNALVVSGREVLPLVEGGKGISISNGESSGAWAACGGVATFSGVNADSFDENENLIPQTYRGRTRRERHEELIRYAIEGGIQQARVAWERSGGQGRIHVNVLWEMAAAERILNGVLEGARELINGVTCGAGMPYRIAEICERYGVHYYPIVSSSRAFRALWKRAYHKFRDWLGGVVYEDPWLAGGHNGISNSDDPERPEQPYPRVHELRQSMREFGLAGTPIIMAGGVWNLAEWEDWLDNPELGPVAFQFGTRPLLTKESPISEAWKRKLLTLREGDVYLNRFSPTGFYSSAVRNTFLNELQQRSERQVAYSVEPVGDHLAPLEVGARRRIVYLTPHDRERALIWVSQGFTEALRTPDSTLIFVAPDKAYEIRTDQIGCMGCLSACQFSNWAQTETGSTGKKADPRSFCIQKTLQAIRHSDDVENQLMFAGHNAFRFARDPFYANGFIPTVRELIDRLKNGRLRLGPTTIARQRSTLAAPAFWARLRDAEFLRYVAYIEAMTATRPFTNALELLRTAHLRPTRQRLALARLLFERGDRHVTAEQLHGEAHAANVPVSLATIYNALHQFIEAGLLREVVVSSGRSYFDTNVSDHHHFFFEDTGRLLDIPGERIGVTGLPTPPKGASIRRVDVIIRVADDPAVP